MRLITGKNIKFTGNKNCLYILKGGIDRIGQGEFISIKGSIDRITQESLFLFRVWELFKKLI